KKVCFCHEITLFGSKPVWLNKLIRYVTVVYDILALYISKRGCLFAEVALLYYILLAVLDLCVIIAL
ncbi:MAG: hypothetical protein RR293_02195, partial [Bacteroidales bacterium]